MSDGQYSDQDMLFIFDKHYDDLRSHASDCVMVERLISLHKDIIKGAGLRRVFEYEKSLGKLNKYLH